MSSCLLRLLRSNNTIHFLFVHNWALPTEVVHHAIKASFIPEQTQYFWQHCPGRVTILSLGRAQSWGFSGILGQNCISSLPLKQRTTPVQSGSLRLYPCFTTRPPKTQFLARNGGKGKWKQIYKNGKWRNVRMERMHGCIMKSMNGRATNWLVFTVKCYLPKIKS